MADVILLEPWDFVGYPVGGQTTFAKQMMDVFGNRLALVGFSTDDTPVGRWVEREFKGVTYKFLAVSRVEPRSGKPAIPLRVTSYLGIRKHRAAIMSLGVRHVFIQAADALLACHKWGWNSICFCFPGTFNSLSVSRYPWARPFGGIFEWRLCRALRDDADVILACADRREIGKLVARTRGMIPESRIIPFPTRADTKIFHPQPKDLCRQRLRLSGTNPLFVSCARITYQKGWDLLLDAFDIFHRSCPVARLIYVGDGEDRPSLEQAIHNRGLSGSVTITGFQARDKIALYNNAADLFLNGSHVEGWPIAQVEAVACGVPIVSTDVSGARDLIANGKNGFIVKDRDPMNFADAMREALSLPDPKSTSLQIAQKYALSGMAADLSKIWPALATAKEDVKMRGGD